MQSLSALRFEVIRIWYAKFKMTDGKVDVRHYPTVRLRTKKRSLEATLSSPRKGHHEALHVKVAHDRHGFLKNSEQIFRGLWLAIGAVGSRFFLILYLGDFENIALERPEIYPMFSLISLTLYYTGCPIKRYR